MKLQQPAFSGVTVSSETSVLICTQIISHPNNLFEIVSKEPVKRERNLHNRVQSKSGSHANTHRGVFLVVEDFLACGRISPMQKKC